MLIFHKKILKFLFAIIISFVALNVSYLFLPFKDGYPFLAIYPATFLIFMLCGFLPGVVVTLINTIISLYFFTVPYYSFEVNNYLGLITLSIYLLSSIIIGYIIYKVQHVTDNLREANNKLDIALNSQKQFVENAAHQLRTPLAGLKLNADYALSIDDYDAVKLIINDIKEATNRAVHLVNQLLVLAKSESISNSIFEKKNDLSIITKDCATLWVPKALLKNIDITFESPENPVYILCDETLIMELISNLLSNSICYGRYGGNTNIKIIDGKDIFLIIEDDGIGIQENELKNVFKRFYRVSGSPGNGCGLGLSIVKEIANIHQASIEIISGSFCKGTTIKISFKKYIFNVN